MHSSRTFSIHFWINLAKEKDGLAPIYARITVEKGTSLQNSKPLSNNGIMKHLNTSCEN